MPNWCSSRLTAVYGSYVATKAHQHVIDGKGYPDRLTMARFVEEAEEVARLAEDVRVRGAVPEDDCEVRS